MESMQKEIKMITYKSIIGRKCCLCEDGVVQTKYEDENSKIYDMHTNKIFCDSCLAKLLKLINATEISTN